MQELSVTEVQEPEARVIVPTFWEDLWDGKVHPLDVLVQGGLSVSVLFQLVNLLEGTAKGKAAKEAKDKEAADAEKDDVAMLFLEDEEEANTPLVTPEISETPKVDAVADASSQEK
eukprot:9468297-Pyramimonas_sp.AAC.3